MIKKYKHRLNAVLTLAANSLNCLNMSKKIVTSRIQIRPKNSFSFSHSIKIKEKNSFMFSESRDNRKMSRPSRFMRSMTPSSSVKMSASKFNIVCGRPREIACQPNFDRVPNPRPPKAVDARVTTPTLSRREFGAGASSSSRRERSVSRADLARAPLPPARESSLYLPFGSYADIGCHTKAPSRY